MADAKDTIKLFAFSDHAGILRAMAENSLKTMRICNPDRSPVGING